MHIHVNYYAMFREEAGCSGETIETESGDVEALFEQLKEKHGFSMCRSHVRLAINDAFVDWNTPLSDGDSVVFIPPRRRRIVFTSRRDAELAKGYHEFALRSPRLCAR